MSVAPPTCESLVEAHLDAVFGLARAWSQTEDQAREWVQRTFLKAFEKRDQLRDPKAARAWLLSILRNERRQDFRSLARAVDWEPDAFESLPNPESDPQLNIQLNADLTAMIPPLLANLPAGARQVLQLRFQQEMSYEEIATFLDVPVGTVMSRLHRAKVTLRRNLESALPKNLDAP